MTDSELKQKSDYSLMEVKIDGRWSGFDFATVFHTISLLHPMFADQYVAGGVALDVEVISIRYGSPGSINILGIGEALKQVKELLIYAMERDLRRERMQLENRLFAITINHQEKIAAMLEKALLVDPNDPHQVKHAKARVEKILREDQHYLMHFETLFEEQKLVEIKIKDA